MCKYWHLVIIVVLLWLFSCTIPFVDMIVLPIFRWNILHFIVTFFGIITAKSKTDQEDFLFPPLKWLKLLKCLTPNPINTSSYKAACTNLKKCLIFSHIDLNCISLYSMSIGGATDALAVVSLTTFLMQRRVENQEHWENIRQA